MTEGFVTSSHQLLHSTLDLGRRERSRRFLGMEEREQQWVPADAEIKVLLYWGSRTIGGPFFSTFLIYPHLDV